MEAENPRARAGANKPPEVDLESNEARDAFRGFVTEAKRHLDALDDLGKEVRETKGELKGVRGNAKRFGFDVKVFDETVRRERLSEAEREAERDIECEFEEKVSMYERWIRRI